MDAPAVDVALETSRREASVALARGAEIFADEPDPVGPRAHASDLLERLAGLLERAGVARRDGRLPLGAVFVGLGPGSYTGLRVGIATAQALARASGAPLFGLPSFEVLAFAALAAGEQGDVAMDARAGRFYHARYRRTANGLEALHPPAALDAAELNERCARAERVLAHPGLAEAAGLARDGSLRVRTDARPDARALLALGRARVAAGELRPTPALEPLYLQPFGASPGPARRG